MKKLAEQCLKFVAHTDSSDLLDKIASLIESGELFNAKLEQDWHREQTWVCFPDDSAIRFNHPSMDIFEMSQSEIEALCNQPE